MIVRIVLSAGRWIARLAALAAIAIAAPAAKLLLEIGPHGGTVRAFGSINEPDGPTAHVITYAGWPGLIEAAGGSLLVLVAFAASLFAGTRLVRTIAWVVLTGWVIRFTLGFANAVIVLGAIEPDRYWPGLALGILATLGATAASVTAAAGDRGGRRIAGSN